MANIAYIRVSSVDQNEARQHAALSGYQIDKLFIDHGVSGKDSNRPQLQAMLDYVREGDTIYISEFSRLARNTKDLLVLTENLQAKGVTLVSLKENLDTTTPTGKLMLTMIAAIAEFERELLLERQREGIAAAKAEGKYKGRQVKKIDDDLFRQCWEKYQHREMTKAQMAEALSISRPTLNTLIHKWQSEGTLLARQSGGTRTWSIADDHGQENTIPFPSSEPKVKMVANKLETPEDKERRAERKMIKKVTEDSEN